MNSYQKLLEKAIPSPKNKQKKKTKKVKKIESPSKDL